MLQHAELVPRRIFLLIRCPIRRTHWYIICCTALLGSPALRVPSTFGNIYGQPDDQRRRKARREQEREAMPDISRLVDDRLEYVWSNNGRRAMGLIRQSEQAKELQKSPGASQKGHLDLRGRTYHKVEPRWAKIGHHRL